MGPSAWPLKQEALKPSFVPPSHPGLSPPPPLGICPLQAYTPQRSPATALPTTDRPHTPSGPCLTHRPDALSFSRALLTSVMTSSPLPPLLTEMSLLRAPCGCRASYCIPKAYNSAWYTGCFLTKE